MKVEYTRVLRDKDINSKTRRNRKENKIQTNGALRRQYKGPSSENTIQWPKQSIYKQRHSGMDKKTATEALRKQEPTRNSRRNANLYGTTISRKKEFVPQMAKSQLTRSNSSRNDKKWNRQTYQNCKNRRLDFWMEKIFQKNGKSLDNPYTQKGNPEDCKNYIDLEIVNNRNK